MSLIDLTNPPIRRFWTDLLPGLPVETAQQSKGRIANSTENSSNSEFIQSLGTAITSRTSPIVIDDVDPDRIDLTSDVPESVVASQIQTTVNQTTANQTTANQTVNQTPVNKTRSIEAIELTDTEMMTQTNMHDEDVIEISGFRSQNSLNQPRAPLSSSSASTTVASGNSLRRIDLTFPQPIRRTLPRKARILLPKARRPGVMDSLTPTRRNNSRIGSKKSSRYGLRARTRQILDLSEDFEYPLLAQIPANISTRSSSAKTSKRPGRPSDIPALIPDTPNESRTSTVSLPSTPQSATKFSPSIGTTNGAQVSETLTTTTGQQSTSILQTPHAKSLSSPLSSNVKRTSEPGFSVKLMHTATSVNSALETREQPHFATATEPSTETKAVSNIYSDTPPELDNIVKVCYTSTGAVWRTSRTAQEKDTKVSIASLRAPLLTQPPIGSQSRDFASNATADSVPPAMREESVTSQTVSALSSPIAILSTEMESISSSQAAPRSVSQIGPPLPLHVTNCSPSKETPLLAHGSSLLPLVVSSNVKRTSAFVPVAVANINQSPHENTSDRIGSQSERRQKSTVATPSFFPSQVRVPSSSLQPNLAAVPPALVTQSSSPLVSHLASQSEFQSVLQSSSQSSSQSASKLASPSSAFQSLAPKSASQSTSQSAPQSSASKSTSQSTSQPSTPQLDTQLTRNWTVSQSNQPILQLTPRLVPTQPPIQSSPPLIRPSPLHIQHSSQPPPHQSPTPQPATHIRTSLRQSACPRNAFHLPTKHSHSVLHRTQQPKTYFHTSCPQASSSRSTPPPPPPPPPPRPTAYRVSTVHHSHTISHHQLPARPHRKRQLTTLGSTTCRVRTSDSKTPLRHLHTPVPEMETVKKYGFRPTYRNQPQHNPHHTQTKPQPPGTQLQSHPPSTQPPSTQPPSTQPQPPNTQPRPQPAPPQHVRTPRHVRGPLQHPPQPRRSHFSFHPTNSRTQNMTRIYGRPSVPTPLTPPRSIRTSPRPRVHGSVHGIPNFPTRYSVGRSGYQVNNTRYSVDESDTNNSLQHMNATSGVVDLTHRSNISSNGRVQPPNISRGQTRLTSLQRFPGVQSTSSRLPVDNLPFTYVTSSTHPANSSLRSSSTQTTTAPQVIDMTSASSRPRITSSRKVTGAGRSTPLRIHSQSASVPQLAGPYGSPFILKPPQPVENEVAEVVGDDNITDGHRVSRASRKRKHLDMNMALFEELDKQDEEHEKKQVTVRGWRKDRDPEKVEAIICAVEDGSEDKKCEDVSIRAVYNDRLTRDQCIRLGKALAKSSHIKRLCLAQLKGFVLEVANAFYRGISNSLSVREIALVECRIADSNATIIIEAIEQSRTVTSLSLSKNKLRARAAEALRLLLQRSTRLRCLDISNNDISDDGFVSISRGLAHNVVLQKLIIDHNIDELGSGVMALCRIVENSRTLKLLDMRGTTEFAGKVLNCVIKVISSNKSLETFLISENGLNQSRWREIGLAFQQNDTIRHVFSKNRKDSIEIEKHIPRDNKALRSMFEPYLPNLYGNFLSLEDFKEKKKCILDGVTELMDDEECVW